MTGYIQQQETGSAQPYTESLIIGVLRQIREPKKPTEEVYMASCPCLCVPLTKWAVYTPCFGGFAIIDLGC